MPVSAEQLGSDTSAWWGGQDCLGCTVIPHR